MSQLKHTPGPWFISDDIPPCVYSMTPEGDQPCIAATDAGSPWSRIDDVREATANASLIAAAPELLAALQQAVTSMQDHGWRNEHLAVRAARAAIAKATGEA